MLESQMDIHPAIDTGTRYDVVLTSPVPELHAAAIERIRRAIADQLQLSITIEARSMDIWVLTAPLDPVAYSAAYGSATGAWVWNSDWAPAPADIPRTPDAVEEWLKSQVRRIPAIGMAFPPNLILPLSCGVLMLGDAKEDGSRLNAWDPTPRSYSCVPSAKISASRRRRSTAAWKCWWWARDCSNSAHIRIPQLILCRIHAAPAV
jgi:hypothetical protein